MNVPAPRERRKPIYPIKLVERKREGDGKSFWQKLSDEPEQFGKLLYDHPSWIDEFFAIGLLVFGLVTIFALLAASPAATLSGQWSDAIRQLFGYAGALMFAGMITLAGLFIILFKLGVDIPLTFRQVMWLEVAFFALLALIHTVAADPEPRALARSGQGGGYIGWALSQVMISLFGSVMTTLFYILLMAFAIGVAVGITRGKVRAFIGNSATAMLNTAERLRQIKPPQLPTLPPLPRLELRRAGAKHVRRTALASEESEPYLEELEAAAEAARPKPLHEALHEAEGAAGAASLQPQPVALQPANTLREAASAPRLRGRQTTTEIAAAEDASAPTPPPLKVSGPPAPLKTATLPVVEPAPPTTTEPGTPPPLKPTSPRPQPLRPAATPAIPGATAATDVGAATGEPPVIPPPAPPPLTLTPAAEVTPSGAAVGAVVAEGAAGGGRVGEGRAEATATGSTPKPASTPKSKSTPRSSKPRIVLPPVERIRRHFTVADFQEARQRFVRAGVPALTLLNDTELNRPTEDEINTNARIIEDTLLEFDVDVEVVEVKVGPTVTQYAVQPFREVRDEDGNVTTQRVRVQKIAGLSNDLALALSAKRLRVQPFVPGHTYMGIEVPNKQPSTVALRPVMESETFAKSLEKADPDSPDGKRAFPLMVPLGREVSGVSVVIDLATMPHLLIAGTTGSGKSVCITAMIVSLVLLNAPDRVRLVLLDPKMVELARFNGLPHLLGPVETDHERIIGVLRWATREMDRRYKLLEAEAARNIEVYNRALGPARQHEQLPYIVILVDEIGDLMLARPEETERTVTRLAQMARAVGMHLVIATQRPSVDIITGLIKANFPARISFAVASGTDSRVILDSMGAESLMGRGDMLYFPSDASAPRRVQGCYVSDAEIDAVVDWWKRWDAAQPLEKQAKERDDWAPWERAMTRREELSQSDPMLEEAIALVVKAGEASTSMIQRQLNIPYPRAATLMDLMGTLGILGAVKDAGRSREVLIKPGTDPYRKLMSKIKK
jgi:S-DNA-T family DNA segregation ATPase FtsK/SpoIIIE